MTNRITILIADDKEVLRLGLKQLVEGIADCQIIGEAYSGQDAVDLAVEFKPDVVLIKRDLPLLDGVSATARIKRLCPSTAVILLLSLESDFWSAIDSGADGYIMRETPEHLLAAAIQTVHQGHSWIGPMVARYILKGEGLPVLRRALAERVDMPSLRYLSSREKEVLCLLTDGLSNQAIAESLALQLQTVKVHVRSILKKLNVEGRAEAISKVLKSGASV
ncbi:MAG: response regulator transcription factor [Candidatus Melainabacteria bacterium]|nr:response regulator transcription factor [Candidatus Melainabacteria bacterium]